MEISDNMKHVYYSFLFIIITLCSVWYDNIALKGFYSLIASSIIIIMWFGARQKN